MEISLAEPKTPGDGQDLGANTEGVATMSVLTIDLPFSLEAEVAAAVEAGAYADEETLIADAIRTLLAARPDLREVVACRLYARGVYSLSKAAEWSGLSIEQMKRVLHLQGVERSAPETPEEVEGMAKAALRAAGRDHA